MRIKTTQYFIKENYPDAYQQILNKKRKSTSKSKNTPPEECEWYISYCVIVEAVDILSWQKSTPTPSKVGDCSFVCCAGKGFWESENIKSGEIFSTVQEHIDKCVAQRKEEDEKEQQRINSLSEEERSKEVEGLLKQLNKSKGFCGFNV